jgi:hypothetical protein
MAGTAISQSTSVISLFFGETINTYSYPYSTTYSYSEPGIDASVITANADSTVYNFNCAPTPGYSGDCGYGDYGANLTVSGDVAGFTLVDTDFVYSIVCTVTDGATCWESAGGASANFPGTDVSTYSADELSFWPFTITAGLEKLTVTTPTPTPSSNTVPSSGAKSSSSGAKQTGSAGNSTTSPSYGNINVPWWVSLSMVPITAAFIAL